MFGIGLPELFIISVIAIIFVGPDKLPSIAQSLGRGMREFKKTTDDIKQAVRFDSSDTHEDQVPAVAKNNVTKMTSDQGTCTLVDNSSPLQQESNVYRETQ